MTSPLAAILALSAVMGATEPIPCERPSDCPDASVCISGTCRIGSASSAVEELYPLAVPPPIVLSDDVKLQKLAKPLYGNFKRILLGPAHTMLSSEQLPFTHRVEGVSQAKLADSWQAGAIELFAWSCAPVKRLENYACW